MKCCADVHKESFVISSLIGLVSARASARVVRIKEDIENEARRKSPQPKCGAFTRHNDERTNVAGVHLIPGFIFEYEVN